MCITHYIHPEEDLKDTEFYQMWMEHVYEEYLQLGILHKQTSQQEQDIMAGEDERTVSPLEEVC